MLKQPIDITGIATVSALGSSPQEVRDSFYSADHLLTFQEGYWAGRLPDTLHQQIKAIQKEKKIYRKLDPTVLYGLLAGRLFQDQYPLDKSQRTGINMGSSRGATTLWEEHYEAHLQGKALTPAVSPSTTLGNLSTWLADDLGVEGPVLSHSITCSTALHAVLNGVAWLQSDMAEVFLVGGSEAPLTSFTQAQMKALKLTSPLGEESAQAYPCRSLDLEKTKNHLVLGEGAGLLRLEKTSGKAPLARIVGVGYSTERLESAAGLTPEAECFQRSMKAALGALPPEEVDAVVMHAPGTVKGDWAETRAIQAVFCNTLPFLTTHKWKIGHTFGASGIFSLLQALLMLEDNAPLPLPFPLSKEAPFANTTPEQMDYVLVNAVGFGGNAVSILLSK